MKFEIGDRVIVEGSHNPSYNGIIGIITEIVAAENPGGTIAVLAVENRDVCSYWPKKVRFFTYKLLLLKPKINWEV